MEKLELRLFGRPRAVRGGVELRFDTRKALALLAVLAVDGREYGRDALAGLLWPELDRSRARAALRRTLSVTTACGPTLVITPDAVRLDAGETWCDVTRFRAEVAAEDPASWTRAAELAGEAFLEGFALRDSPAFEDWQIATSDALRDAASHNLGRLVARAAARDDLPAALGYARRRTQIEPMSEPAHADLIRVTAWSGDRPGALQAYRALVRLLERELGVPPLPETLALHEQIRAGTLAPPTKDDDDSTGAAQGSPPPAADVRPSRLVGRAELLAALDTAWASSATAGASVGLVGDAGMGKTALLGVFADQAAGSGRPVLRLTGHAAERGLAYAAANDLVRGMLTARPDLTGALGPAARPLAMLAAEAGDADAGGIRSVGDLQRLHESARAALGVVAARGALVVIDDAHLLDPPSAALLAYCARRLPRGLLIVAAWPSVEGRAVLPEAIVEDAPVLVIPPLTAASIAELLVDTAHDPLEVLRRTRGVPLLVSEYIVTAPAEGAGVRDVVSARFDSVAPTTRQIVAAAAVIGTVADPELLRVACGRDESETVDAIEEAIARGLLVERADRPGYDVPHDLVRDAALTRLSLARARLMHGRVAEVLARRHGIDPRATPAGAVARHLADAGRDADAVDWFLIAAAENARLFAHVEALDHLRAAQSLGHRALDVHQAIGTALVRLGRYADALVSLDRAAALVERDGPRSAEIEHAIAGVYDRLSDADLARAHLDSARELLDDDDPRLPRVLADLALVEHRSGRPASAARTAAEARTRAFAADHTAALAQAANVLGVLAAADGAHGDADVWSTEAVARSRETGDLDLLIAALNNRSRVLNAAGDREGALAAAREALDLAERQGDRHRLAALHSHVADLLHDAGREDEALAELKISAAAFGGMPDARTRPEVWTLTEW